MSENNLKENNGKLISIDEVIILAQKMGVDFGDGDPRHRLRYYTKIGLLPHAQRKSFNNHSPEGAYEESVIGLLVIIDKKIKSGKSIQTIKRETEQQEEKREEREEKNEKFFGVPASPLLPVNIYDNIPSFKEPEISEPETISEFEENLGAPVNFINKNKIFRLKFLVPLFIGFFLIFLFTNINGKVNYREINFKKLAPYFLAAVTKMKNLAQAPAPSQPAEEPVSVTPVVSDTGSYLTINADTAIKGSLDVENSVTSPQFTIIRENFRGTLETSGLSADRTYTFPDQSGVICLATGNCVGLAGITATGGVANRLTKFISSQTIGNSSINDLYAGLAVTISSTGKIGIGTATPREKLDVAGNVFVNGNIQATGDICTDIGGKCLSQMSSGGSFWGGGGGISGSGNAGNLSVWTSSGALGDSIVSQSGSTLSVGGTISMTGFQLATGAASGYVLTSDGSGIGAWQALGSTTLPSATANYTLRGNGTSWVANSFLYNTGSAIGIGTTSTTAVLTVAGDGLFQGPLTISTTTFPQLVLEYGTGNFLKFLVKQSETEISASSTLVIDSLTGEIRMGSGVSLLNATSATVWGKTFISPGNDATVRKSGELILRSSVPIFKFPVPAQTTSTVAVEISRLISTSTLDASLPSALSGTTRYFVFLLNFADDIVSSASSTWLIDLVSGSDTTFYFAGQGLSLSELDQGISHMSSLFTPPTDNWQLKVSVPSSSNTIRVSNIFLLIFDRVN